MKLLQIIIFLIAFCSMGYAATRSFNFEAEKLDSVQEHTRQKRGLLLAKAKFLGGSLLAKKALVLGTGAGFVGGLAGGGLAGATVYKLANHFPNGGGGGHVGYGYPTGYVGTYGGPRGCVHGGAHGGAHGRLHGEFEGNILPQPCDHYGPPCVAKAPNPCC